MTYSTANPPRPVLSVPYNDGASDLSFTIWMYRDADAAATVQASGYFTNANTLGMKDGDWMLHYDTNLKVLNSYVVLISGTTYDVSNATVLGSGTDSD